MVSMEYLGRVKNGVLEMRVSMKYLGLGENGVRYLRCWWRVSYSKYPGQDGRGVSGMGVSTNRVIKEYLGLFFEYRVTMMG